MCRIFAVTAATAATCLTEQYYGSFKPWHGRIHRGLLWERAPIWLSEMCAGDGRGDYRPPGLWKMLSVNGLCYLAGGNCSVSVFKHTFSWGALWVSEAFTSKMYFFLFEVDPPNKTELLNTKSKILTTDLTSALTLKQPQCLINFEGKSWAKIGPKYLKKDLIFYQIWNIIWKNTLDTRWVHCASISEIYESVEN